MNRKRAPTKRVALKWVGPPPAEEWPRLGLYFVPRSTRRERIEKLAARLAPNADDDVRAAVGHLRTLARNERALEALDEKKVGRPTSDAVPDIALDYVVRKELLDIARPAGAKRGNAKPARGQVSEAWDIPDDTVREACSAYWQRAAKLRLENLIGGMEGTLRVGRRRRDGSLIEELWTRPELLEAVRDDLHDRHANVSPISNPRG